MNTFQGPILSYLFLTKDVKVLRWILIVGGVLALGIGGGIGGELGSLELPLEVFFSIGGLAIVIGGISFFSQHVQRHMFDYTFLVFVFVYLGVIFISFLNKLDPALIPLLISVQILFAIAFRNFFEYLVFAIGSLLLFGTTSFAVPDLQILPALFFVLIVLVTSFTGAYVWLRERFLSKVNNSNRMLGDLLNNSVFGIFLLDLTNLEMLYQNQIAEELMLHILGRPIEQKEDLFVLLNKHLGETQQFFLEAEPNVQDRETKTILTKSGEQLDLELYLSKIRTLQNDSLLLKIRDITEKKRVESALKNSEENYQEIFNAGNSGIFILEPETYQALDVNKILCKMMGYAKEELLELPFSGWGPKDELEQLRSFLELTKEGQANQKEWIFLHKDGSQVPVELNANLAVLGGEFRLMLIVVDIQERIEKRKALEASEQKYRTLVEKMNEGLVMTDNNERILFVNKRMCEIIGMEQEELLGQLTFDIFKGKSVKDLIQNKSALRQQGISDQYELEFRKKDDSLIWLSIAGSPYVKPPNEIVGTIAIVTDITHRKTTELKLQEKNSELDAFVYKASHDLKGPLASIIGVTNIARAEVSDPKAHQYFDLISKSTKRLDLILSELIDVTRINKSHLKLEPVKIPDLVEDIVQSLQHLPHSSEVAVEKNIKIDQAVITDKKLLTSILQNLIVNGITYHNPQADTPLVKIDAKTNGSRVLFAVKDNGLGISDRMKKKVFEMFYRGNTKSKGSGLGLYIVKSAVDKLGGTLELESEEGQGTCFSVALPLHSPPPVQE